MEDKSASQMAAERAMAAHEPLRPPQSSQDLGSMTPQEAGFDLPDFTPEQDDAATAVVEQVQGLIQLGMTPMDLARFLRALAQAFEMAPAAEVTPEPPTEAPAEPMTEGM